MSLLVFVGVLQDVIPVGASTLTISAFDRHFDSTPTNPVCQLSNSDFSVFLQYLLVRRGRGFSL